MSTTNAAKSAFEFLPVLSVAAAIGTGLMAGLLFAFSNFVMRSLAELPAEHGMAAMQRINTTIVNPLFLVVFVGSAILALAVLAISISLGAGRPVTFFVAAAACYLVGVLGVTAAFNIPLNNALAAAGPGDASVRWPAYLASWVRWNHVRTGFAVVSLLCYVLAIYRWASPGSDAARLPVAPIAMYTHVVLLRGINVGKAKRVPMATFKSLLLGLGCKEVKTLLNSGNAVVLMPTASPSTLAREVATAIYDTLGFEVAVVVKSMRDFRAIVLANRLLSHSTIPSRLLVAFTQTTPSLRSLASIAKTVRAPDQFLLGTKAAYLHCPGGILESGAAGALLGSKGNAVTTRNWATVLKLNGLLTARG